MITKKTYTLNVKTHYDDITELRKAIEQNITGSSFKMTAVGFVDGVPFSNKNRKGLVTDYAKIEHFCIALKNPTTDALIYIILPYEMPNTNKVILYVKQGLAKYRLTKNKIRVLIHINKLIY